MLPSIVLLCYVSEFNAAAYEVTTAQDDKPAIFRFVSWVLFAEFSMFHAHCVECSFLMTLLLSTMTPLCQAMTVRAPLWYQRLQISINVGWHNISSSDSWATSYFGGCRSLRPTGTWKCVASYSSLSTGSGDSVSGSKLINSSMALWLE